MIDVSEEISAVRREVGDRVLEAGNARVVTVGPHPPHGFDPSWEFGGDTSTPGLGADADQRG